MNALPSLDTLQVFVKVAELSSFTQAALSLGVPKASVSTAVQRLEASLGTRLFHRTTRRVQLTQDGQACLERCLDLLSDLGDLQTMFQPTATALTGRLRVDIPLRLARDLLTPALPAFFEAHPGIELELSSTDRRVDVVREGFDCVLRVGPLNDSSLVARPLGALEMVNLASADYLARHGEPHSLDDLASHQLIHYAPLLGQRPAGFEWQDEQGGVHVVPMAGSLTVNNSEAYIGACLAGLGLVQVPRRGNDGEVDKGRLREVLPHHRAAPMPVHLLYPHRRQLPRRVQVFMQWLADLMAPRLIPLFSGGSIGHPEGSSTAA
ncbi:LysR family transcriptional regulator [Roseateles terrae]|uniref:DNA-binding transcriptional LysR family regulator n=1 Tax=Roseateles terrae TaxID=431060 RepID=A0ABR6GV14_9BURK|nr:LysR family transcriptional regulator [Roseateles terrae]MBB3195964.1 DNA-binding transcriptional LysR family regulator [Roseateles terrae]OWQ85550.1 LysR family transcriptional regulator [Roseateles terrae]